jgi:hypothetical protein
MLDMEFNDLDLLLVVVLTVVVSLPLELLSLRKFSSNEGFLNLLKGFLLSFGT